MVEEEGAWRWEGDFFGARTSSIGERKGEEEDLNWIENEAAR